VKRVASNKQWKKYNWSELKKEFMAGEYKTVNEFCREKKIARGMTQAKYTKGWTEEKKVLREKLANKTIEKAIEKTAEKNAEQLATVNDVAEVLLRKISEATNNLQIEDQNSTKLRTLEYDNHGKVKREATIIKRKNTALELANALSTIANILASGTESQENKLDKYFDELSERIDDGIN
jgi:hypothetical protein